MNRMTNENSVLMKTHAFRVASEFLKTYYVAEETVELRTLLSGMAIGPSGLARDAGTMHTWVESLAKLRSANVEDYMDEINTNYPDATAQEWLMALSGYIDYYNNIWKSKQYEQVLSDIASVKFDDRGSHRDNPIWKQWLQICVS